MVEIVETARAKINLALHVTGRRPDGYHLLESIVTFTETGDRLTVSRAASDTFSMTGPFAAGLPDGADNLVLRARDALRAATSVADHVAIHLDKRLPVASGIGGGSADAAACLRALSRLWDRPVDKRRLADIGIRLGADVPMCLESRPLLARGIGEDLTRIRDMPPLPLVLVNPLVEISTPAVFDRLHNRENPPIRLPEAETFDGWVDGLRSLRNDLQAPAETILPVIADIQRVLRDNGALLARMSGSGATCFGIYADETAARAAAGRILSDQPSWYVVATSSLSGNH